MADRSTGRAEQNATSTFSDYTSSTPNAPQIRARLARREYGGVSVRLAARGRSMRASAAALRREIPPGQGRPRLQSASRQDHRSPTRDRPCRVGSPAQWCGPRRDAAQARSSVPPATRGSVRSDSVGCSLPRRGDGALRQLARWFVQAPGQLDDQHNSGKCKTRGRVRCLTSPTRQAAGSERRQAHPCASRPQTWHRFAKPSPGPGRACRTRSPEIARSQCAPRHQGHCPGATLSPGTGRPADPAVAIGPGDLHLCWCAAEELEGPSTWQERGSGLTARPINHAQRRGIQRLRGGDFLRGVQGRAAATGPAGSSTAASGASHENARAPLRPAGARERGDHRHATGASRRLRRSVPGRASFALGVGGADFARMLNQYLP
jgi:hypothetical protein